MSAEYLRQKQLYARLLQDVYGQKHLLSYYRRLIINNRFLRCFMPNVIVVDGHFPIIGD